MRRGPNPVVRSTVTGSGGSISRTGSRGVSMLVDVTVVHGLKVGPNIPRGWTGCAHIRNGRARPADITAGITGCWSGWAGAALLRRSGRGNRDAPGVLGVPLLVAHDMAGRHAVDHPL